MISYLRSHRQPVVSVSIRIIGLLVLVALESGCTRAEAFAPVRVPSPTAAPSPVPIKPPTATRLPIGKRPIFVIDPNGGMVTSHVIVIDPDAGRVVGTIPSRYAPEAVFSPDGSRLYVADSYSSQIIRGERHHVISIYDPLTGNLVHDDVEIPDRLIYKMFPSGHPSMFFSYDSRHLFVGKYGDPDMHNLRMAVLDSITLKTISEYTRPECSLMPLQRGELLCVGYGQQPSLLDSLTGQPKSLPFLLPAGYQAAILSESRNRLSLLFSDANSPLAMAVVDLYPTPHIVARRIELTSPIDSAVGFNHVAMAPDGSRLYVGFVPKSGDQAGRGLATSIWAFDALSGARVGVFERIEPAWHVAISRDGTRLYAVNPFERSLSVFDTSTFRQILSMRDLGDTPAFILVPPGP